MSFVKKRFHLADKTKVFINSLKPEFGYDGFGEFIYARTYSRLKDDGYMESWGDTVKRVTEGVFSIRKDWHLKNCISWNEKFWQDYAYSFAHSMFKMEWLPPGRGLWAMGTEYVYERGSMALQNCGLAKLGRNFATDIHWLMDALMNGVGVGFIPERDDELQIYIQDKEFPFVIDDSREGWCDSVRALIRSFLIPNLPLPVFDYKLVRAVGQPIRGFGGVSSGPEPLKILHKQIKEFFLMYKNEKWYDSVLLKADIANAVGCCVVAGNVRRSAELCMGEIDDETFLNLKDYGVYPHREFIGWMSNNPVALRNDEDFEKLGEVAKRVISNGEPGTVNMQNISKGRIGREDECRYDHAIGYNPCQPYSAIVCTKNGLKKFGELREGDIIWSQCGWATITKKWSNGVKPVYKYKTRVGYFEGTEDHRIVQKGEKVKIKNAETADTIAGPYKSDVVLDEQAIVDGLMIGDGTYHKATNKCYLIIGENDSDYFLSEIKSFIQSKCCWEDIYYEMKTCIDYLPYVYNREVPDTYFYADRNIVASFLRGLYSANGSICGNRVNLKAASLKLIEQVQIMLSSLGIRAYYTINKSSKTKFNNGEYLCEQSYDLNISTDKDRFSNIIGFVQKYKTEELDNLIKNIRRGKSKKSFEIVEIEYTGDEEVFDITVDNIFHTYWSGGLNVSNCGEQSLEDKELCTLVETLPTKCKSSRDWLKACEYATVYASTVTLLPTHRPETNAVMFRNRRIGVGIVDFTGWVHEQSANKVIKWLRKGYKTVRDVNRRLNAEVGIPESIKVTTVKPGGTTPKIAGKTSGCGYPTFEYTLRRVRVAENSPITSLLLESGLRWEKDYYSQNTLVFEWPIKQGPAKEAIKASLWEQAFNLVTLQREWSDNAVSNTLYFRPKWLLVDSGLSFDHVDEGINAIVEDRHGFDIKELVNEGILEQECTTRRDEIFKIEIDYRPEYPFIKIYRFNPNHEEGDIEPVLSMIAPLTKSVSLLPHTTRGVYRQMPEEGITKEEYEKRLSEMKLIDWSKLRKTEETEVDRYCDSSKCEVLT